MGIDGFENSRSFKVEQREIESKYHGQYLLVLWNSERVDEFFEMSEEKYDENLSEVEHF